MADDRPPAREEARPWTRIDEYVVSLARVRSARRRARRPSRGPQPEEPRFVLSTLPFLVLHGGADGDHARGLPRRLAGQPARASSRSSRIASRAWRRAAGSRTPSANSTRLMASLGRWAWRLRMLLLLGLLLALSWWLQRPPPPSVGPERVAERFTRCGAGSGSRLRRRRRFLPPRQAPDPHPRHRRARTRRRVPGRDGAAPSGRRRG